MSWKPARGHGITYNSVCERERKYRILLSEYEYKPVGIPQFSKTYYHWLVAERDLEMINFCESKRKSIKELYGKLISPAALKSLERHKELCYKPLQKLFQDYDKENLFQSCECG